jgi:hypothetical protein
MGSVLLIVAPTPGILQAKHADVRITMSKPSIAMQSYAEIDTRTTISTTGRKTRTRLHANREIHLLPRLGGLRGF